MGAVRVAIWREFISVVGCTISRRTALSARPTSPLFSDKRVRTPILKNSQAHGNRSNCKGRGTPVALEQSRALLYTKYEQHRVYINYRLETKAFKLSANENAPFSVFAPLGGVFWRPKGHRQ